jgi:uncharacterized membrane protein
VSFNKISGQRIPRIESLSDGVFGIAMTLLVFNLKDPLLQISASETQLWEGLCSIIPNLLTFFFKFCNAWTLLDFARNTV